MLKNKGFQVRNFSLPDKTRFEVSVYLKQIEITGFKSFADKTRLHFEPGMIAIVGPNGCGKSNVSDAIRWVLGEQRPTALRCAKMPDVIFNGTDSRKPLGMAEVAITFADCEGLLDTEFNEVTISRRVFRSGDGQYFLNKNPCRLKDIQRLFMGTGIGTTSYSVMAQGQIDAILSSKPEDRRAVFEEAAGITKFKADRKEALRKIEQTDSNLLRLADVIREVKRQIGTLQRQAGKAQKYKELRDELRGLDIFLTRRRLAALDVRIRELDTSIHALNEQLISHQEFVAEAESESSRIHGLIHETEERIAALTEQAAQADNRYARAQEVIKVNEQRIAEYRAWAERDNREISETQAQIGQLKLQLESLGQKRLLMQQAAGVERAKLEQAQAPLRRAQGPDRPDPHAASAGPPALRGVRAPHRPDPEHPRADGVAAARAADEARPPFLRAPQRAREPRAGRSGLRRGQGATGHVPRERRRRSGAFRNA